jgi:thiamine-monophosphate kinase
VYNEKEVISLFDSILPAGLGRLTKCFESDAEELVIDSKNILLSTDQFSEEDMLREDDPYSLGWNATVGALADIYASGATPRFYSHAVTAAKSWDIGYMKKFCTGIADVLKLAKTEFAGGDMGLADNWSYTATVIGIPSYKRLSRKGASSGDSIYMTGRAGAGNLEAGMKLHGGNPAISRLTGLVKNRFHLRIAEAEIIREFARCCIDTSDGVFNALNTIAEINSVGYEINNVPYIRAGVLMSVLLKVPVQLLFLGGCGEYELLFTVDSVAEKIMLKKAGEKRIRVNRLGTILEDSGVRILCTGTKRLELDKLDISARMHQSAGEYLDRLIYLLKAAE